MDGDCRHRSQSQASVVEVPVEESEDYDKEESDTLDLQETTAECCIQSVVELWLAGSTLLFTLVVLVWLAAVVDWLVIGTTFFAAMFFCEVNLRIFAFGRSYVKVLSNLLEILLTYLSLALGAVICHDLVSGKSIDQQSGIRIATAAASQILVILRLRRFQDVIMGALVEKQPRSVSSPDKRVLELLKRLRRKYPLNMQDSHAVNWACFLIASRKLYSLEIPTEPSLFEGLDEETTNWLLNTYSNVPTTASAAEKLPPTQQPRPGSQSIGWGRADSDDSQQGNTQYSDSALLDDRGHIEPDHERDGVNCEKGKAPLLSLELSPVSGWSSSSGSHHEDSDTNSSYTLDNGEERKGEEGQELEELRLPTVDGRIATTPTASSPPTKLSLSRGISVPSVPLPSRLGSPKAAHSRAESHLFPDQQKQQQPLQKARRKSLNPRLLSSRKRGSGGFESLDDEFTCTVPNAIPPTANEPQPPNTMIGRQTSGPSHGIIKQDLETIRNAVLLSTEIPVNRKELLDQITRAAKLNPSKAAQQQDEAIGETPEQDFIGSPSSVLSPVNSLDDEFDSTEAGDEFDFLYPSPPKSKRSPIAGSLAGKGVKKHGRARTSLSSQTGKIAMRIKGLAENARLRALEWAPSDIERINLTMDEWGFDVFEANEFSGGRPLSLVMLGVLRKNQLFQEFGSLREETMMTFITAVENGYRVENPYHNRIHAADVLQTVHYFFTHVIFRRVVTPQDIFCSLIAAAIHDFQHPGTSNSFLVATGDKLALRYNDRAVLEHMHVSAAFQLMRSKHCDVLRCVGDAEKYHEARETMIQMVLATDMSHHFEGLERFKTEVVQYFEALNAKKLASTPSSANLDSMAALNLTTGKHNGEAESGDLLELPPLAVRRTLLKTALHCADVSNPAKNPKLCQNWAMLVQEEFFQQGDKERERGLKISMFMDRTKPAFHKCQIGFITIIVKPLFASFCQFLTTLKPQVDWCLTANVTHWEKKQAEEEALQNISQIPQLATSSAKRSSFRFVPDRLKKSNLARSQSTAPQSPSSKVWRKQRGSVFGSSQPSASAGGTSSDSGTTNSAALKRSKTDYSIDVSDV